MRVVPNVEVKQEINDTAAKKLGGGDDERTESAFQYKIDVWKLFKYFVKNTKAKASAQSHTEMRKSAVYNFKKIITEASDRKKQKILQKMDK